MSSGVFKDLRANEIYAENNESTVVPQLKIHNRGSGDAEIRFQVGNNTFNWSVGVDNSATDSFNIGAGSGIGTSDSIIISSTTENVGIGGASVASGKLTVNSTTSGFLPPRMTSAQMEAITTPAEGCMVYNSTSGAMFVFISSSTWQRLTTTAN